MRGHLIVRCWRVGVRAGSSMRVLRAWFPSGARESSRASRSDGPPRWGGPSGAGRTTRATAAQVVVRASSPVEGLDRWIAPVP